MAGVQAVDVMGQGRGDLGSGGRECMAGEANEEKGLGRLEVAGLN